MLFVSHPSLIKQPKRLRHVPMSSLQGSAFAFPGSRGFSPPAPSGWLLPTLDSSAEMSQSSLTPELEQPFFQLLSPYAICIYHHGNLHHLLVQLFILCLSQREHKLQEMKAPALFISLKIDKCSVQSWALIKYFQNNCCDRLSWAGQG